MFLNTRCLECQVRFSFFIMELGREVFNFSTLEPEVFLPSGEKMGEAFLPSAASFRDEEEVGQGDHGIHK